MFYVSIFENSKKQQLLDAIMSDNEATAIDLIVSGVDVNITSSDGMSLLDIACHRKQVSTVEALLNSNAKISLGVCRKRNAAHWAVLPKETGKIDDIEHQGAATSILECLIEKDIDIQKYDKDGMTPLLWAVWAGNTLSVHALLAEGVDPKQRSKCKEGLTASHYAALTGHAQALRHLIRKGADLTAVSNDNETLLHVASRSGQNEIIQMILQEGFDLDASIKNNQGETALDIAKRNGHRDIVAMFEQEYARNFVNYQKMLTEKNSQNISQKKAKALSLKRRPKR